MREYNFDDDICDVNKIDWSINYAANFKNAMDDDFNTSLAISILFELVNEINRTKILNWRNYSID